ncbi:MAG: hypothetical protein ACLFUM_08510 [Spirochaetaceae bacterium]
MRMIELNKAAVLASALVLLSAVGGFAQEGDTEAEEDAGNAMEAGDIDIGVSGGLGGFLYPYLAPQIDVGVLPVDAVTISAGARANAGYCLLCGIFSALDDDWTVRSFYVSVLGRALVHFNDLADGIDTSNPLDAYAGLMAGPGFYRFGVEYDPTGDSADTTLTTVIFGPSGGAKLFFDERQRGFAFLELAYLFEVGFESTEIELAGETYTIDRANYASSGLDFSIGLGMRL